MGGRGPKAEAGWNDTDLLCANTGGNTDPESCHQLQHRGHIKVKREDGVLYFKATITGKQYLARRGIQVRVGTWTRAKYDGVAADEVFATEEWDQPKRASEVFDLGICW
jgi:hypothetical protein